jgi:acetolactate synthase-1/2/3 large subunit
MTAVEGHAGRLAAEVLRAHDVDTIFTLNGGHLWPLYDGANQLGMRFVDTRHEQSAGFAAEAWAKVTRRVGCAMLTAGPGITNGVSALTSAHLNGTPMLVLGGRAPALRWGSGSLQELDHIPIVQSVCRYAQTAWGAEEVTERVDAALRAARAPHRGPAFVDIPLDGFGTGTVEIPTVDDNTLRGAVPDDDAIARVALLVAESERPVVIAGGDVYFAHAEDALVAWARVAGVPVYVNGMGRGTIPADDELAFARTRSLALKSADLVIVAGTRLDFRLGFGRFADAKVVHLVDAPSELGTHAELAASVVGDLRATLTALHGAGDTSNGRSHASWVAKLRDEERAAREAETVLLTAEADPIKPTRVYGELIRRLDRDAIVIGDGGDFVSYAGKYVDSYLPGTFLDPGPYGCLGIGPGYALAAATAFPDRQVVLMLGDGAAGFAMGDWDTLVRHAANVIAIVGNNSIWGLEKHPMQALFGYDIACDLTPGTRYDQVMESLGGHGELVEHPEQLGPALDRALATPGPSLVNVLTDPADQYPRSSNLA